ncbi:hypothetical protein [Comamonas sp. 4034]|uniref:hypothetical protein n=1 Tax=Comamonas sp. 4034 TaxID=3156455 RepID=UPI003D22648E
MLTREHCRLCSFKQYESQVALRQVTGALLQKMFALAIHEAVRQTGLHQYFERSTARTSKPMDTSRKALGAPAGTVAVTHGFCINKFALVVDGSEKDLRHLLLVIFYLQDYLL